MIDSTAQPLPPPHHKKSDAILPPLSSSLPHTQNNLISSSDDDFDDDEFDDDDDDDMDYNDPEKFFATEPPISVAAALMQKHNRGGTVRRGSNLQPLEYIPASEIQPALASDDEDDLYCDPEASLACIPPTFHGRGSDGEDIYTDGTCKFIVSFRLL